MKVSELAIKFKTTADTVRYYTLQGLLKPDVDPFNGYKQYGHKDSSRLNFILSARDLGFTIKDIKKIFNESDKGRTACPLVRTIIEERLKETEENFKKTLLLRNKMEKAINSWKFMPDKEPNGLLICHLIEDFYKNE
jgi:DNA-binding transcriptional MerR regulator